MKVFERALAGNAAIGTITVDPSFKLSSADPNLGVQTVGSNPTNATALFSLLQGSFAGRGFNTLFRPNNPGPGNGGTVFPNGILQGDILELNLMKETLSFSPSIGLDPNRGEQPQPDIFLYSVPYLQVINDVTNTQTGRDDGSPIGIHFEPGFFLHVPGTTVNPVIADTVNRIASIPHGVTINAQGLEPAKKFAGGPKFNTVDITPINVNDGSKVRFPAQTASNQSTARIPQDLSKFIATGTITQSLLDNPNLLLQQAVQNQVIDSTFVFTLNTIPSGAITGGGVTNNAFLTGNNAPNGPQFGTFNANVPMFNATFWVETVNWTLTVPQNTKAGITQLLQPVPPNPNVLLPTFKIAPPHDINIATNITVQTTQIQYSQFLFLVFHGRMWPHTSVNTLTQQGTITVNPSVFL